MKVSKDIYFSDSLFKKRKKILRKMKHNKFIFGLNVITLPMSDYGMFEIYPYFILLQKQYLERDVKIVGVGASKGEALELAASLVTDCYNNTGDFDIKEYLER